ncbi:mitochondrial fission ELM1 family protein [Entomobacter blattae]|uniref:Mitochondrial fission ELM1 n=1 Tax=Entomobacter blattae TaxID=2762277 RepID=A0A7H1NT05_9PROT|nr:mitochondrial fission ELM1 family protein [Entomobacter blattae]QNT78915.1 Mitochondrial fission ELM1 [Entomobacter blattae]
MRKKNVELILSRELQNHNVSSGESVAQAQAHGKASLICLDLAGMRSQGLGVAERCQLETTFVPVSPRFLYRKIPSQFWINPHKTIQPGDRGLAPYIISVGGTGGRVGSAIKKTSKNNHLLIQIQNPRQSLEPFDVVIANYHDEITGPNVLLTRTAMHRVSQTVLERERQKWDARLAIYPRPLIAVLLGGNNGRYSFGPKEAEKLSEDLAKIMQEQQAGLVITPSRRTDPKVIAILQKKLGPLGAWIWDMQGENPYFGLLSCADCIMVTMDSVSMVSEAVATQAPVYIIELPGKSRRIKLFLEYLLKIGRIRLFEGQLHIWPAEKLDDTDMAVEYIKEKVLKIGNP